ncbi:hypothetical protein MRX96_049846 [Rhipicephalus microplus]
MVCTPTCCALLHDSFCLIEWHVSRQVMSVAVCCGAALEMPQDPARVAPASRRRPALQRLARVVDLGPPLGAAIAASSSPWHERLVSDRAPMRWP